MPTCEALPHTCCGNGIPAFGRKSITPLKRLHSSLMSSMSTPSGNADSGNRSTPLAVERSTQS